MYVYRVELKASAINANPDPKSSPKYLTNLGPYRSREYMSAATCRWLKEHGISTPYAMPYKSQIHPLPTSDPVLITNILQEYDEPTFVMFMLHYGFMDNPEKSGLVRLMDWFDEESRESMNNAYCIMKYNARECYDGHLQSIFDMNTATLEEILFFEELS
ncbi:hypothetical protein PHYNN_72 [Pantoea phage Phynn]|nr:hypothetical protein PHYNN_72 [Pantoea phage Phynn]